MTSVLEVSGSSTARHDVVEPLSALVGEALATLYAVGRLVCGLDLGQSDAAKEAERCAMPVALIWSEEQA